MKPFLIGILFLAALLTAAEPDQTFELTFDTFSTTAEHASGKAASTTFTGDLGLRMLKGVNGKNAFSLREGESLKYDVAGNIDHRQGTLSIWLKAENYDPSRVSAADSAKSHKSFVNILFRDGDQWTKLYLYEYYDTPIFFFYWASSFAETKAKAIKGDGGGAGYKLAGAGAATIRQRQWFQLAVTWDAESIRIYLDGELKGQNRLPAEAALSANLKPSPAESYLGIRDRLWPEAATDVGQDTVVDDLRIWSRTLNALEIRRQYLLSAPDRANAAVAALPAIDIQLKGVDDAHGDLDRMRVDLDYRGMPAAWQQAITAGGVAATSRLTRPDGTVRESGWTPASLNEVKWVSGVSAPGSWRYDLELRLPDGSRQEASASLVRPDTSWQYNGLGEEDVVPSPWTPMTVDGEDRVQVWNRTYTFKGQPFPLSVVHGGDELLRSPPRLVVETAAGAVPIAWQKLDRSVSETVILLRGTGAGPGFTLDWETSIEFDGMVRCDWRFHGAPEVRSMRLEWTVDRRFSDYVLDPNLVLSGEGTASLFPVNASRGNSGLWLTSRSKGFCWAPEHDANWVYERGKVRPVSAVVSAEGGACRIDMVQGPVRIPEGATYHAMFIATPSRPLPTVSRTYRLGGYGRQPNCDVSLEHHVGEGTEGVFTLRPGPRFSAYCDNLRKRTKKVAIYGGAIGLNDRAPEWGWFGEYWAIPGGPCPPFSNKYDGIECMSTAACPRTSYSDYMLDGIRRLFNHPANLHTVIYFDLAGVEQCANPLHGCSFTDVFGVRINRLNVMAMRAHLMRTMKYCHRMGRETIYHAHSYYHPMVHAFGDYWFPGEQYCSLLQRENSPYVYSDCIPDAVYRSELCQDLKGSGILFLGNLKRANKNYGTEEQTLAMCTKLLLNDVPISMAFEDGTVINRIWGAALRYHLDSAVFTPYYDPAAKLRSDNPQVVASVYQCSDGRILAMVGNLSAVAQSATFDLRPLRPSVARVRDEYRDEDLPSTEGTLKLDLAPRHFRIIGF